MEKEKECMEKIMKILKEYNFMLDVNLKPIFSLRPVQEKKEDKK